MRICLLGAGNVAVHLGKQLQAAGYKVLQVYSRTDASARSLAQTLACAWTDDLQSLSPADYYLCALKDEALPLVLQQIPSFPEYGCILPAVWVWMFLNLTPKIVEYCILCRPSANNGN